MTRTGLLVALVIAAIVGLVFGLYPRLDLRLAALFYEASASRWMSTYSFEFWSFLRRAVMWIVAIVAAPAVVALVLNPLFPNARWLMPTRKALFLAMTLALGPGLVANVILKDNWNRPRPGDVVEFGGRENFVAWWDPRGTCNKNCSFIAGEPSGAFWTLAPAALAPPQWRALAYGAALGFGAAAGLLRMVFGAHFFSDVVFSGVLIFLVVWIVYGLLFRWRLPWQTAGTKPSAMSKPGPQA